MAGSGRIDWRRVAAAAALIAVLVFGLGFVLRAAGLGTAANVAQLVSLAPIAVSIIDWSRAKSPEKEDPGLDEPGTALSGMVMLWISVGLLCIVAAALILQIWDIAPQVPRRTVDWGAGGAGLASCIALVAYRALVRRQPFPLSSSLQTLLERQRDLAQRHQYVYSDGTAPPIGKIYVDQWADWLMPKSATGLPAVSLSLPDLVRGNRNAIILADPGVGKSTAVAQVVGEQSDWWLNAKRFMKPDHAPYGAVIPVVLPADLHRCDNLSAAIARQWTELTNARVDARAFARKPPHADAWLVLIDGIDQVLSTKQRVDLLSRLGTWTANPELPVRFLLTSRPLPSGELGPLWVEHVGRYRLRKFDIPGLHRFVEQWAAFRAGQNLPDVDLRPITAKEFMAAVRASHLLSLAQVPLVATITALILEYGQETELPTTRAELYERFITQLFASRRLDQLRDDVPDQWRPYGRNGRRAWHWLLDNLRDMLEGAAHRHLSVNPTSVVRCARQWVDDNAPPGLLAGLPDWGNILKGLLTATSLVVLRSTGLEFTHPNIEEYLAAGPRGSDFNAETWLADARSRDSRSLALFVLARVPGQQGLADQLAERLLERGGTELCIAGAIVADGIEVAASARARVLGGLMDLLAQDGPDTGEALETLITLASREDALSRLEQFAEDAAMPAWVRADVADELCGLSREAGLRLLRVVLGGTQDSLLRDRIMSRLDASGDLRDGERDSGTVAEAAHGTASTGNWAGHWYRQIAQDRGAEAGHRLRALLAMAERRDSGWTSMLPEIITAPALPDSARRDAASRIGQLGDRDGVRALQRIAGQQKLGLEIRVFLLAGLAGAQDEESRQALSRLAADGGSEFRQRFSAVLASQLEAVPRSSEQFGEPSADYPEDDHEAPRIFNVPRRNVNFVGRGKILDRLWQSTGRGGVTVVSGGSRQVLHGFGGVGKTQIALEFAHRHKSDYDLVWWVPSEDRASIASTLAHLAGQLGTEAAGVTGTDQAVQAALDALGRGEPFRRWLLIFDNAHEPDDLVPYLPGGSGDILITSRNPRWESAAQEVEVDVFSRGESVELLSQRLGQAVSAPDLDQVASELGDLPLALEQAGAWLSATGIAVDVYLSELKEAMTRLTTGEHEPYESPTSVSNTWRLSISRLRQQSPEAVDLLRYCSFLGPDPIPRDVLRSPQPDRGIDSPVADPVSLAQSIRELSRFSLVAADTRTVRVHRLIQVVVRNEISAEDQKTYRHAVQAMLAVAMPADPEDDGSWPRYRELLPHVTAPALELERSGDSAVRDCAVRVLRYLNAAGDAASSRQLAERIIAQWTTDSGPDDTHVLDAQRHLAVALRLLGHEADADQLTKSTLDRARRVLGEQNPLTQALRGAVSTELLLVLGGAVVKTAFRLWAGEKALAEDTAAGLAGLVSRQVDTAFEQRKVLRWFEEIEDIVAEQATALVNTEFRSLEEREKNAAISAVTETFNRAGLTDRNLFTTSLDPLYLANAVRPSTEDSAHDLSREGTALYDRLLPQCCAYISEIADKLPRFQAAPFAELLSRYEQIRARIEEVLARLPAPAGSGGVTDQVDTAYRQHIAMRLDRIELFGLDFASQWYPLSAAYLDLNITVQPTLKEPPAALGTTVEYWLNECPRLLIEGGAGSGKTTLLQRVAVLAARRDFAEPAAGLNQHVPFLLRLRQYAGRGLPAPEEFLEDIAPMLAPEARAWPRELLRSGRAVILADGLDEVPEAQRPTVLSWLRELTELFPLTRYLVTSRPGVIQSGELADAGFVTATVEPMDPGLTQVFINRWHTATREWQKDTQAAERIIACRDELLRTLERERFLRELASTPLLAALICALNLHLNAQLPLRRAAVLETVLRMFHQRDRQRGIHGTVTLDPETTTHLLGDLALWMVRNQRIELSGDDPVGLTENSARNLLRQSALSLPSPPPDADLYQHLLLHSGVLHEPAPGHVDFVHRMFQDYLAAWALIRTDNVGEIVKNADDDQWHEIVVFASSLGTTRQTSDLLRGLLRRPWPGQDRHQRASLGVACLNEIRAADPAILADIERAIPELLPPRSIAQAEAVGHAGERLIPHLAKIRSFRDTDEVAAVIRAAALIGGPRALDVIARIAARRELNNPQLPGWQAVRGEYMRSWQYFTSSRYVERVLLPAGVTDLDITSPPLLIDATDLPVGIKSVTLRGSLGSELDLSAISGTPVADLRIVSCDARRITGLHEPWKPVRRLRLEALGNMLDVPSVRLLPNLQALDIVHCDKLTDYTPFSRLANLRTVYLEGRIAGDIGIFDRLPDIDRITITGAGEIDLTALADRSLDIAIDTTTVIAPLPARFRPAIRRI